MQGIKWNRIVFLSYLAYCVFFFILFWNVFDNNELYHRYYPLVSDGLKIGCIANAVSQIWAIFKRQWHAVGCLLLGVFMMLLTIVFTIGMGV